ncbi:hypothetical protein KR044_010379 [Drosophila immigrans]|nr:hypothetical protein KR044_010379 [Drosophila immigrans]
MSGWFWLCTFIGLLSLEGHGKSTDERNYLVFIDQFTVKRVSKEYFEDLSCVLKQIHNHSSVDCNLMLRHNVNKINMEVYLDMVRSNKRNIRLFNTQLEVCEFWTLVHKNPLFNILAKTFIRVIDENIKCPLKAHLNYSFTNWYVKETDMPNNLPDCHLKAFSKFYTSNKLVLTSAVSAKIIRKS